MRSKIIYQCIVILWLLSLSVRGFAQDNLVITGVQNMYLTKISEPILREAYQQLGIQITVKLAPGERALNEANSGRWDGDLNRKAGLEKKYRNLIMIPVSESLILTS